MRKTAKSGLWDDITVCCWYGWCAGTVYGYHKSGWEVGGNGLAPCISNFRICRILLNTKWKMTKLNIYIWYARPKPLQYYVLLNAYK